MHNTHTYQSDPYPSPTIFNRFNPCFTFTFPFPFPRPGRFWFWVRSRDRRTETPRYLCYATPRYAHCQRVLPHKKEKGEKRKEQTRRWICRCELKMYSTYFGSTYLYVLSSTVAVWSILRAMFHSFPFLSLSWCYRWLYSTVCTEYIHLQRYPHPSFHTIISSALQTPKNPVNFSHSTFMTAETKPNPQSPKPR